MKKILLTTIISGATLCLFAQTPTWDFESWTGTGANIEPTGWISENVAVLPPLINNPQSVFQETDVAHIHGGTYALKITSVKMTNNPATGKLPDPIGIAAPGAADIANQKLKFGFPSTIKPSSVSFWYQYAPASGGDVAGCLVTLTAWNTSTNKRDTVAFGIWTTTATVTAYTTQSVAITYTSTTAPDSMSVIFSSTTVFNTNGSMCLSCGKPGSTLWVDDISFTIPNGIIENPSSSGVSVYPNPAGNHITIAVDALKEAYSVQAYDITGNLVATTTLNSSLGAVSRKSGILNTTALASGIYSYSILDKSGATLRAGKFSVK